MNIWDVMILLALAMLVAFAVRRIRRHGKAGQCSCGCEGCDLCRNRECKPAPDK